MLVYFEVVFVCKNEPVLWPVLGGLKVFREAPEYFDH